MQGKDKEDLLLRGVHLENLDGIALLQTKASSSVGASDPLPVKCEPDTL